MIIISPSGNLYGSEQVLLEYIDSCTKPNRLFVPVNSLLEKELKKKNCKVKAYKKIIFLYWHVFLLLLLSKQHLYLNEAGHIRYVKALAKLLPHKKFFVHIRLKEDCSPGRLHNITKNIHLITVSEYLKSQISTHYPVRVIYDPYTLKNKLGAATKEDTHFSIGIVGRVTKTKGLDLLLPILNRLSTDLNQPIILKFFGSYAPEDSWCKKFKNTLNQFPNIKSEFKGFVSSKQDIYSNINLLLHLNKVEALGRILFEAIDYNTPYLVFNEGGCGELSKHLELVDFLVNDNENWVDEFVHKIELFLENSFSYERQLLNAKKIIKGQFDAPAYAHSIDSFFRYPTS